MWILLNSNTIAFITQKNGVPSCATAGRIEIVAGNPDFRSPLMGGCFHPGGRTS